MQGYLVVFLGAGIGGMLRHAVNTLALRQLGPGFGYGTLAVNVLGSFLIGLFAGWLAFRGEVGQLWRLGLVTGLLGGFTTFSAFSLDAVLLYQRGELAQAVLYVAGSVGLSLLSLVVGISLMRPLP
jgi:CrcB protein